MSKTRLKRGLNSILSPLGVEVHRRDTEKHWLSQIDQLNRELDEYHLRNRVRDQWLRQLSPRTVIDVGANVGQFAKYIRAQLPTAMIYAFEPLPDCFAAFQAAFAGDPLVAAFNIGLGEIAGELPFQRNQSSPSSSFLKIADAHIRAFPFTAITFDEVIKVDLLDRVVSNLNLAAPLLIKVDVQGFEDKVLRGGESTTRKAEAILVETSFVELYQQQPLFDDLYTLLRGWGFSYQGSFDQLRDPHSGAIIQEDSVFVKPSQVAYDRSGGVAWSE